MRQHHGPPDHRRARRDGALRDQVQRFGGEAGVLLAADMISATGEFAARRALRTDASVDLARYSEGLAMLEQILPRPPARLSFQNRVCSRDGRRLLCAAGSVPFRTNVLLGSRFALCPARVCPAIERGR